jgi:hypothetical protein
MADEKESQRKQPFVGHQDRPEVGVNPDEPISSLRVRDLLALLKLGAKSLVLDTQGPKSHFKDVIDTQGQGPKSLFKDVIDAPPKHFIKEAYEKDLKDIADTYVIGGSNVPDPTLRQTIDALVKEVAQLREEVNRLKR